MVLALAERTGWSRRELLALDVEDLRRWLDAGAELDRQREKRT